LLVDIQVSKAVTE